MAEGIPGLIDGWLAPVAPLIGPVYPWISAGHILALGLLIGSIVALDLRLLGFFRRLPVADLADLLVPLAACGLGAAIVTGLLLFSVQPSHYLDNPAFLLKLVLIAVGLANVSFTHFRPNWRRLKYVSHVGASVKLSAGLSLLVWIGAVFAGRWIAFL